MNDVTMHQLIEAIRGAAEDLRDIEEKNAERHHFTELGEDAQRRFLAETKRAAFGAEILENILGRVGIHGGGSRVPAHYRQYWND